MTTNTIPASLGLARILQEGYGPGAWHGPDLKAAVADVTSELAFARPQPERHNIAEIALHHAYTTHNVRTKLTGKTTEPFAIEGDDWFPAENSTWPQIAAILEDEQQKLMAAAEAIESGRATSPLSETEQLELLLGVTCHAVYHAGQVQLLKRLQA